MLDQNDKKEIKEMIFDGVVQAMEQVLFPRFDKIEEDVSDLKTDVSSLKEDVGGLKEDVRDLKEDVGGLKQAVEILQDDTSGVKMRLKVIENKIDTIADTSLTVRNHEKRISKLEKVVA